MEFGSILKKIRSEFKITQKEASKAINIHLSRYVQIERIGIKNISKAKEYAEKFVCLIPDIEERERAFNLLNDSLDKKVKSGYFEINELNKSISEIINFLKNQHYNYKEKRFIANNASGYENLINYIKTYQPSLFISHLDQKKLEKLIGTYAIYEYFLLNYESNTSKIITKRYLSIFKNEFGSIIAKKTCPPPFFSDFGYEIGFVTTKSDVFYIDMQEKNGVERYRLIFENSPHKDSIYSALSLELTHSKEPQSRLALLQKLTEEISDFDTLNKKELELCDENYFVRNNLSEFYYFLNSSQNLILHPFTSYILEKHFFEEQEKLIKGDAIAMLLKETIKRARKERLSSREIKEIANLIRGEIETKNTLPKGLYDLKSNKESYFRDYKGYYYSYRYLALDNKRIITTLFRIYEEDNIIKIKPLTGDYEYFPSTLNIINSTIYISLLNNLQKEIITFILKEPTFKNKFRYICGINTAITSDQANLPFARGIVFEKIDEPFDLEYVKNILNSNNDGIEEDIFSKQHKEVYTLLKEMNGKVIITNPPKD